MILIVAESYHNIESSVVESAVAYVDNRVTLTVYMCQTVLYFVYKPDLFVLHVLSELTCVFFQSVSLWVNNLTNKLISHYRQCEDNL